MSHSPTDESSAPAVAGGPRPATENSLRHLLEFGQSLWLDDLRRSLFTSGEFSRLIAEDGLRGVTSNPSIFERALADGTDTERFYGTSTAPIRSTPRNCTRCSRSGTSATPLICFGHFTTSHTDRMGTQAWRSHLTWRTTLRRR